MSPVLKPLAEVALALLARREHAVKELQRKLTQKGYALAEVRPVLADMQARGYLNDARYAIARARYRVGSSKWGWGRVAQELAQVGITPDDVAAAKAELEDQGISLHHGATLLARRKLSGKPPADKEAAYKQRQKAMAALLRKGYSLAEAKAALDEAAAAE